MQNPLNEIPEGHSHRGAFIGWVTSVKENPVASNTAWMAMGLGVNAILQAAAFVLLARLLGTAQYGFFAGAYALVTTFTPYSALGSQMIFMRYVSVDRDLARVYWGNLLAIVATTTLLLLACLPFAAWWLLGSSAAATVAVLVIANGLMGQITDCAGTVFQTFHRLKRTAGLRALNNFSRALSIGVLMLLAGRATAFQSSLALLAGASVAAIVALFDVYRALGGPKASSSLIRRRLWEAIGFSVAGSTQAVYNDVDKTLLSHFGMQAQGGLYTFAYRLVDFATVPINALDAAVLPRLFQLNADGFGRVARAAKRVIPIAVPLGAASALLTLTFFPVVLRLVGPDYRNAVYAIRWLCILPVFRAVHQLMGGVLTATGLQHYRTIAQFAVAALNVALNLMWIPSHGWLGAAWASLASDGALAAINALLVVVVCPKFRRLSDTR